jgi:hypothetical protein
MSSVIVTKVSVILAFKFIISGTGVENTLSLTYPHKKKSREVRSGDSGGQGVGPSLPIHLFGNVASKNRRKCEHNITIHTCHKIAATNISNGKKICLYST